VDGGVTRSARRPFAVAFLERKLGTSKNSRMAPGGSFLALGADGPTFYTLPEDHFNCAVGARTHNVRLSAAREKETEQTLERCLNLPMRPEEMPQIPPLGKGLWRSSLRRSEALLRRCSQER
jgi:hypothetical protein